MRIQPRTKMSRWCIASRLRSIRGIRPGVTLTLIPGTGVSIPWIGRARRSRRRRWRRAISAILCSRVVLRLPSCAAILWVLLARTTQILLPATILRLRCRWPARLRARRGIARSRTRCRTWSARVLSAEANRGQTQHQRRRCDISHLPRSAYDARVCSACHCLAPAPQRFLSSRMHRLASSQYCRHCRYSTWTQAGQAAVHCCRVPANHAQPRPVVGVPPADPNL